MAAIKNNTAAVTTPFLTTLSKKGVLNGKQFTIKNGQLELTMLPLWSLWQKKDTSADLGTIAHSLASLVDSELKSDFSGLNCQIIKENLGQIQSNLIGRAQQINAGYTFENTINSTFLSTTRKVEGALATGILNRISNKKANLAAYTFVRWGLMTETGRGFLRSGIRTAIEMIPFEELRALKPYAQTALSYVPVALGPTVALEVAFLGAFLFPRETKQIVKSVLNGVASLFRSNPTPQAQTS